MSYVGIMCRPHPLVRNLLNISILTVYVVSPDIHMNDAWRQRNGDRVRPKYAYDVV